MGIICVVGVTGTIGRAVVAELVKRGFGVVCLVRGPVDEHLAGTTVRMVDVADRKALAPLRVRG